MKKKIFLVVFNFNYRSIPFDLAAKRSSAIFKRKGTRRRKRGIRENI